MRGGEGEEDGEVAAPSQAVAAAGLVFWLHSGFGLPNEGCRPRLTYAQFGKRKKSLVVEE